MDFYIGQELRKKIFNPSNIIYLTLMYAIYHYNRLILA